MANIFSDRFNNEKYLESIDKFSPPVKCYFDDNQFLPNKQLHELLDTCWDNSLVFDWEKNETKHSPKTV